jgi:serine/threonine protein kinase
MYGGIVKFESTSCARLIRLLILIRFSDFVSRKLHSAMSSSAPLSSASLLSAAQLPCVKVSDLPPLTERSGEPGSSGTVFKTTFQGTVVAAKIYHDHSLKALRRELRALNLLAHKNIVRVLAVLTNDLLEPVGFIMEYMPQSLDVLMPSLTLAQSVHVMCGASLGLAVSHDKGILHADVKPANILLSDDGSEIKLADYGLSQALTSLRTSQSSVRGTSMFIAPEHLDGAPISKLCDIFSFGMTCWQMLHPTVTNPLGTTPAQIMLKLIQGKRPPFTRDVPSALRQLIEKCLAHEPTDRPSSMWELHRALHLIQSQLPAAVSAPSTLSQLLPHFPCQASSQTSSISFTDIPHASPLFAFIMQRARSFPSAVTVSRISRVHCPRMREASFCDLVTCASPSILSYFTLASTRSTPTPNSKPNRNNSCSSTVNVLDSREVNSRSSNPVLRPDNPTDNPDFMTGLAALQAAFERSVFGPKSPVYPPHLFRLCFFM